MYLRRIFPLIKCALVLCCKAIADELLEMHIIAEGNWSSWFLAVYTEKRKYLIAFGFCNPCFCLVVRIFLFDLMVSNLREIFV